MRINQYTKIAALLRHKPEALEAIVSLRPEFKRLRNPVLRKLMAGRTSIAMASRIGGCKPEDFFTVLAPIGFTAELSDSQDDSREPNGSLPAFLKETDPKDIIPVDVRQMLSEGKDPLKKIQETVRGLGVSQVMKIINSFEPAPLIPLLKKQGFGSCVHVVGTDLVETYFYRTTGHQSVTPAGPDSVAHDWESLMERYRNHLHVLDVRHLEMPLPMITILETLESMDKLPGVHALYVHHKRVPVFLLSELKDRNFDFRIRTVSDTEVYLLIFKQ